jgi:hypothetical protein
MKGSIMAQRAHGWSAEELSFQFPDLSMGQIHAALRGVDVLTVQEDGRAGASDAAVLDRATELGRVLFTQDDDLLVEASEEQPFECRSHSPASRFPRDTACWSGLCTRRTC